VDQEKQSRGQPIRTQLLWAGATAGLLIIAILIGYRYDITLWDWIKLLIVPAVIAGGGFWFNSQQSVREQKLANKRAQEEALQAYLDQMSQLLLDKERPLLQSKEGDTARTLAGSLTLTVLPRLDGARRRNVLLFLYQSGLITKTRSVIPLSGAYLGMAHLGFFDLSNADLSGANLSGADLSETNLEEADLNGVDLSRAHGLTEEQLGEARTLKGATMPDGQTLESYYNPDWPTFEDWLKDKKAQGKDEKNE